MHRAFALALLLASIATALSAQSDWPKGSAERSAGRGGAGRGEKRRT